MDLLEVSLVRDLEGVERVPVVEGGVPYDGVDSLVVGVGRGSARMSALGDGSPECGGKSCRRADGGGSSASTLGME